MVMHLMMIRMVLLRRIPSGRYHSPSSSSAALLMLLATAVIIIVIIFVVVVVVIARVVCVQEYVPGGKVRIALRSLSVVLLLLLSSIRRRMERILLHSSGRGRRVETSTRENDGYHPVLITVITITTRICCFGES